MEKIKFLLVLSMLLLSFGSINIHAEENDDLVCYYVENCEGELESVCIDPNVPAPCQIGCSLGCGNED